MGEEEKCKCGAPASEEPHTCPYQYDVHNDREYECRCCERCQQNCADDI